MKVRRESVTVSQFWLPPELDPKEFSRSFEAYFPQGRARHIPLVPGAHPSNVPSGSLFFELMIPSDRMDEFKPFLDDHAAKNGMSVTQFPASGFGFSHSG